MFSADTRALFPNSALTDLEAIIRILDDSTARTWPVPATRDPVRHINESIDLLGGIYIAKFKQLYACIAESIERGQFVVYAQAARALLENTATLRFVVHKQPLSDLAATWSRGEANNAQVQAAVRVLEQALRGRAFDWEAFVDGRLDPSASGGGEHAMKPFHIQDCLRSWYKESADIRVLYALLCDLVHPNIGSNLLVLRIAGDQLVVGGAGGQSAAIPAVGSTLKRVVSIYDVIQRSLLRLEQFRLD